MVEFKRIYGDRVRLFRAILACMSRPNKVPIGRSSVPETNLWSYKVSFGRSTRPGSSPVIAESRTTNLPLTRTCGIPTGRAAGVS
jgi:hypothetical protein